MSNVIKDGKGSGNTAEVDDHGRLYTKANVVGHMSHHSTYHKNAYIKSFKTTLTGTSETPCAFVYNNDPTKDIEVYWIKISSDSDVEIIITTGNTYTSGGNKLEFVNTNLGTANSISTLSYEGGSGDLSLNTTNNDIMDGVYIKASYPYEGNYKGGVVIPYKQSLSFNAIGANTNNIKITIGFTLHDKGQKL